LTKKVPPPRLEIGRSRHDHNPLPTTPDIAFIDIGLLGIDGHEVGGRIRAVLGDRVLLVALTAYGREQDRQRLNQAGFDTHLLRPGRGRGELR